MKSAGGVVEWYLGPSCDVWVAPVNFGNDISLRISSTSAFPGVPGCYQLFHFHFKATSTATSINTSHVFRSRSSYRRGMIHPATWSPCIVSAACRHHLPEPTPPSRPGAMHFWVEVLRCSLLSRGFSATSVHVSTAISSQSSLFRGSSRPQA